MIITEQLTLLRFESVYFI